MDKSNEGSQRITGPNILNIDTSSLSVKTEYSFSNTNDDNMQEVAEALLRSYYLHADSQPLYISSNADIYDICSHIYTKFYEVKHPETELYWNKYEGFFIELMPCYTTLPDGLYLKQMFENIKNKKLRKIFLSFIKWMSYRMGINIIGLNDPYDMIQVYLGDIAPEEEETDYFLKEITEDYLPLLDDIDNSPEIYSIINKINLKTLTKDERNVYDWIKEGLTFHEIDLEEYSPYAVSEVYEDSLLVNQWFYIEWDEENRLMDRFTYGSNKEALIKYCCYWENCKQKFTEPGKNLDEFQKWINKAPKSD